MRKSVLAAVAAGLLHGCGGPESAMGFRLPEGDADRGLAAFQELQCAACHDVQGMDAPEESMTDTRVVLGGSVTRVKTYGELVTSIINPSHRLAPGYRREDVTVDDESVMATAYLNQVMTVQELIDLVAWLQPLYEVRPPSYNPYGYAYPPSP